MVPINYNSVSEIKSFLKERGLSLKKRFGQNFLVSPDVREKICNLIDPDLDQIVWEIGPGLGAMTAACAARVKKLVVFEIDRGFVQVLKELNRSFGNIEIVEGDFTKTGISMLGEGVVPHKIFGNLPYSSGSAIIYDIVKTDWYPAKMVFTLQREVVNRMTAVPGTKDYSLFTVICRFAFDIFARGDIKPGSFFPAPEVTSTIVELVPHMRYRNLENSSLFFSLAKDIFTSRRKTLKNNLFNGSLSRRFSRERILEACREAGVDPSNRGETLGIDEIVSVARNLG